MLPPHQAVSRLQETQVRCGLLLLLPGTTALRVCLTLHLTMLFMTV
jgi:hypothetical protein